MAKIISVAKDYTLYPGPRLAKTGKWSGEDFRESVLIPALREGVPFILDLDGVAGYPPSFLEEAFGGLIRCGFSIAEIDALMTIQCHRRARKDEIRMYMEHEENRLHTAELTT